MPSENVDASSGDRRTRKREARRHALLALVADLVEELGPDGLTMAALAEAADYAPASLYTYFPSRSAVLASLQQDALRILGDVAVGAVAGWESELDDLAERPAALARLVAFSRLFLTAPEHHPRQFRLQQRLLVTEGVEDTVDAATVVPHAMAVLDTPRRLLAAAVEAGALLAHDAVADPLDHPLDGALVRTLAWIAALNGALLVDGLGVGMPTTGALLGREITLTLLRGWGADPALLAEAALRADRLTLPMAD